MVEFKCNIIFLKTETLNYVQSLFLAAKNRASKIRRNDLGVQKMSTLCKIKQKQIQNMFKSAKSQDFRLYLKLFETDSKH